MIEKWMNKRIKSATAFFLVFFIALSAILFDEGAVVFASDNPNLLQETAVYNGVDYSRVFDFNYYINKYADLKAAFGNDRDAALRHFIIYGMKEGRQASASFDVRSYKNANGDLRIAFGENLRKYYEHYMVWGYKENRVTTGVYSVIPVTMLGGKDYSKVYDFNYYINKYDDLKKAFGSDDIAALRHFVNYGMKEGRQAKASFDVRAYKNANADLVKAYGNDFTKYYIHYMTWGYRENRFTHNTITYLDGVDYSKVYNYEYYINKYDDLKKAFGKDDEAALRHFVKYGMKEGRQGSSAFDLKAYKTNYADLRNAFGTAPENNKDYYLHYIKRGQSENRNAVTIDGTFVTDSKSPFVFVGDSRFEAQYRYCGNLGGSYVAKGGLGLDWMKMQLFDIYKMKNKYVIFNMGVNDLDNVENYIAFYNSFPTEFLNSNKVIVMTVNPINDKIAAEKGFPQTNKEVDYFNSKLKNELRREINILDSNAYMKKTGFETEDGLHYDEDTYRNLYNWEVSECRHNRFFQR